MVDQVLRYLQPPLAHCEVDCGRVVVLRIDQLRARRHKLFHSRQIARRARREQAPQIVVLKILQSDHRSS